jgi:primosomal protein N''
VPELVRIKNAVGNDETDKLAEFEARVAAQLDALEREYAK